MKRVAVILLLLAGAGLAEDKPKVWVHAPAEDLLGLFPDKGAGFLISLEEYEKLVRLAEANRNRVKERPPVAARIVTGTVHGVIEGDVVRMFAQYHVVVQGDRPAAIAFPVEGAAIETIELKGGTVASGTLHFEKPGTYVVVARLSARLRRKGELRRAAFRLPPAVAHTVAISMPAEVEGEVGPIVRAFKSGTSGRQVTGYPDGRGLFQFWFRPRAPARQLDPLLSASFDSVAEIGEARLVTRTRVDLEVLRAPLDRVRLRLDPGQTVRDLKGKQVKRWTLTRGTDGDVLEIVFTDPVEGAVRVDLETERARDSDDVSVPVLRVADAVRYRGRLGIVGSPAVRILDLRAEGARRLDGAPKGGLALFEIWSADATVAATIERVAAKTRASTQAMLAFREGGKSLRLRTLYNIAGQPLFRLEPRLPAGWILRTARLDNREVPHRYEEDGRLVMVFPGGLKPGQHVLDVTLDTDEVDWVPNEGTAGFALADLRSGLDEETGLLVVASDPAFRVAVAETNGLQKVGMPEIARAGFQVSDRILYGWRFDRPGFAASFELERHRPQISAVVLNRLRPSERVLKVHASVRVEIQRTGVRELAVSLPKGTGKLVDFRGPLIKEKRAPAADADTETWTLVFQKRIRGKYAFDVVFDRKFEEDAWTAPVPEIALPGVKDRGFIVVYSSGATAVTVEPGGLREADVGELPVQPKRPPLEVLAYASHPYHVTISSRRHDPESVVQAIALSAHIYGVLAGEGRLRCRAEYRVRNNDQAFLAFGLPRESTLLGVIVDGKPNKPLREGDVLKVPLPRSRNREAPFVVAIVYESQVEELEDRGAITLERPVLDIDVLKTRYTLHLPHGYALTESDGDLVPLSLKERQTVLSSVGGGIEAMFGTLVPAAGQAFDLGTPPPTGDVVMEEPAPTRPSPKSKAKGPARRESSERAKNTRKQAVERLGKRAEARKYRDARERHRNKDDAKEEYDAEEDLQEGEPEEEGMSDAPFRGPNAGVPPGLRKPGDPEPPPAPAEDGMPGGSKVAHGEKKGRPTPAPGGGGGGEQRKRPERALLSLDVQFLRPDNLVRLDSLSPTGSVTLSYTRADVYDRRHFLGVVVGAAAAVVLLLRRGLSLLRVFPAALLVVLALHFAGLSFLPADFARGAGEAMALVFALVLLIHLVRLARAGARKLRWPKWLRRKRAATTAAVLLLASFANAQDENEILVPYRDDPDRIERVFLPADRYHALRKLAYPETRGRATAFLAAEYAAVLAGEALEVKAGYDILKETPDVERIPMRLDGVAITKATLDGAPAPLVVEKKGYVLVLKGAGTRRLELTLRPRLATQRDARSFAFPVRPVANARLKLEHDRPGHEVRVARLGHEQEALYHLGPVGALSVTWTPETEGFSAATAELRARTNVAAHVRDGFTGVTARIRYGISGGTVDRVRVRVGGDITVRRVTCKDLAGWQIDADGNLVVALQKPATGSLDVQVEAERPAARERTEAFPDLAPLDVLRDAGLVAIETLPELKIEILESQGLMRGRAADAAKALGLKQQVQSVHRFAVRPFTLRWRVFAEANRVRAETNIDVYVEREATYADVRLRLHVERGPGLFRVPLSLPADYEPVHVAGAAVRDWWVKDNLLRIESARRLTARHDYHIVLRRRGATAEPVSAPAISVPGAVRETGLVRVALADGLELEVNESANLLPEDIAKVGAVRWGRLVRAYRFVSVPWRLVATTREEPRDVEALVVAHVVPEADRVRVEAIVNYRVRRGLVDTLSFVVPAGPTDEVLVSATDLREERAEPVEGGRRYTLSLRTPTRGTTAVTITYHLPYDGPVRGVEPEGVSRVERYVAVDKIPDGEIRVTEAAHLEAIDFDDLPLHPPGTGKSQVARVYVGSGRPFAISLRLDRHSFEEVARAVIYRAAAEAVVDRSGWTRVRVSYRVYNRAEQFLRVRLPDGARLYAVVVAGEGVRPLGEAGDLLVPLRKLALGSSTFDVDVLFAYRGPAVEEDDFEVKLPETKGIDVRRTTLSLHLPRGFSYSFETDMEEVEETDLAAGEAMDLYEEIKELYAVAERGNKFQQERALSNFNSLQQKAQRVMDELRSNVEDQAKLRQIDSQQRALNELRRVASVKPKPEATVEGKRAWAGNDALRDRLVAEKRADYEELLEAVAVQNLKFVDDARFKRLPQVGRELEQYLRGGSEPQREGVTALGRTRLGELGLFAGDTVVADKEISGFGVTSYGLSTFADADEDGIPDITGPTTPETPFLGAQFKSIQPGKLRAAKGRISLKIDLPLEGQVFHFARLGAQGGVAFSASEEGGVVLEALLALACAAAAVFVLRFRLR